MGKISAVKTILRSNEKISGAFDGVLGGMFSGITDSVKNAIRKPRLQGPMPKGAKGKLRRSAWDGIKDAHRGDPKNWDTIGGYSARKIAGSYMGISAAGRIATGGGMYRDKDGNADVIGIPLI